MPHNFFTNTQPNSLLAKFNAVFNNNPHIEIFHCVSGYFRASGYYHLKEKLQNLSEVKILVGIDVDKINDFYAKKNELGFGSDELVNTEYAQQFLDDIQRCDYTQENEQSISDFLKSKVEVRIHKSKKLHAKIYVFLPVDYNEHKSGSVITGSSNFTGPGLGATDHNNNYEFNVELRDYADVFFAESEFQSLWAEGIPVDWDSVQKEVQKTHIGKIAQPYHLYVKFLIEYFGERIEFDEDSVGDVPAHYKKLQYQVDAVNEAYKMLVDFNGCFFADVVGLGKTIVAAMTTNKLALENSKKKTRILVVYPPALERNWKETFREFKLDGITDFVSLGSLDKILDDNASYKYQKEDYSIIIVDEAHRFRNANTERYKKLQDITMSPIKNQGNLITTKKVLLLTATPFNNTPTDLLNMICLFTHKFKSTLPIANLGNYFAPLVARYKQIIGDKNLLSQLQPLMATIRVDVIQPITVRRTRKDLQNNKMYAEDLTAQHISFPAIEKPTIFEYTMSDALDLLFADTVDYSNKLFYTRYQMIAVLKEAVIQKYYPETNIELITKNLASLMRVRLIKSLESSFTAFKSTLQRLHASTTEMLKMIESGTVFFAPNGRLMDWLDKNLSYDDIEEEIQKKQEKGIAGFNTFSVTEDFDSIKLDKAIGELHSDTSILQGMVTNWEKVTDDPKFTMLTEKLPSLIQKSEKNPSGKIVIFSESKVTCNYLAESLESNTEYKILNVSSDNRKELFTVIRENFDANSPKEQQKDNYNMLISTEVLAEGVNLHRANHLLNYDIPWNSTKLMQRLGRVNRIGSTANTIYNYAFYPSSQGDSHIDLKNRAYTKLQAFHFTYGEDSQILSSKEQLIDVLLHHPEEGEEDKRLYFLQHIRDLHKTNPSLFDTIKKLPIKSRSVLTATDQSKRQGASSAVFLKTGDTTRFFVCRNSETDTPIKGVDFVAFASLLECEQNTKPLQRIPDLHYADVQNALKEFGKIEIEQEVKKTEKPTDPNIKKLLKTLRDKTNTHNKNAIDSLYALLEQGTLSNVQKQIEACLKSTHFDKSIQDLAKKLYALTPQPEQKSELKAPEKPQIILSETFV